MTSTEELRKGLDEHGVKWESHGEKYHTWYDLPHGGRVCIIENDAGYLHIKSDACTPAQAVAATVGPKITGDTSDGYHTFNELYHHRAMLFSVIIHDHPEIAWKSKKHHDGSMYDGMFIVGLDTPWGHATYHYDIVPYWNQFDCKELDSAPEWDGHTPDEAIARIGALSSLDAATAGAGTCHVDVRDNLSETEGMGDVWLECDACHWQMPLEPSTPKFNFCPNCGRRIEVGER